MQNNNKVHLSTMEQILKNLFKNLILNMNIKHRISKIRNNHIQLKSKMKQKSMSKELRHTKTSYKRMKTLLRGIDQN